MFTKFQRLTRSSEQYKAQGKMFEESEKKNTL